MKKVKINSLIDYIRLLKKKPQLPSLEEVIGYHTAKEVNEDECLIVPLLFQEQAVLLTKNITPSIFEEYGLDGNFAVATLSISHLNFAFLSGMKMFVLVKE